MKCHKCNILQFLYAIYSRFSVFGKKRVIKLTAVVCTYGGPNDAWGKSYGIRKWLPILAAHQGLHYVIYVRSHAAMTSLPGLSRHVRRFLYAEINRNQLTNHLIIFQDKSPTQIPRLTVIPLNLCNVHSQKRLYDTCIECHFFTQRWTFLLIKAKWKYDSILYVCRDNKNKTISKNMYVEVLK